MEQSSPPLFFEEEKKYLGPMVLLFLVLLVIFLFAVLFLCLPLSLFLWMLFGLKFQANFWTMAGVFSFALVGAVLFWWYIDRYGYRQILVTLKADPIDPKDRHHRIYEDLVEEIAVAGGIAKNLAPMVLPTRAINGFSLYRGGNGHIIALTEGAISGLSRAQLQALVAHVVASGVGTTGRITTSACSLIQFFRRLHKYLGNFFTYFLGKIIFAPLISHNILRADATTVKFTRDPQSLAEVLTIGQHSWLGASSMDIQFSPLFSIPPGKTLDHRIATLSAMAHIDREVLQNALVQPHFLASPQDKKQWYVQLDDQWLGPYGLHQIFEQSWFRPELWMRRGEEQFSCPGYSHPDLHTYFQGRIPSSSRKCPACGAMLIQREKNSLSVYQCLGCQGILADQSQMVRLLLRRSSDYSEAVREAGNNHPASWEDVKDDYAFRKAGRVCSFCRLEMRNYPYSLAYPVVLDKCEDCQRVWFDTDEIEILQYLIEKYKIKEENRKIAIQKAKEKQVQSRKNREPEGVPEADLPATPVPLLDSFILVLSFPLAFGGLFSLFGFFEPSKLFSQSPGRFSVGGVDFSGILTVGLISIVLGFFIGLIFPKTKISWTNRKIYLGALIFVGAGLIGLMPPGLVLLISVLLGGVIALGSLSVAPPPGSNQASSKQVGSLREKLFCDLKYKNSPSSERRPDFGDIWMLFLMGSSFPILAYGLSYSFFSVLHRALGWNTIVIALPYLLGLAVVGSAWGLIVTAVEAMEEY